VTPGQIIAVAAMFVALAVFLAIPALIALLRRHPDRRLIGRLTPLTLLSFLLWVALLVWAASDKRDDAVIGRYIARLRGSWHFGAAIGVLVALGLAGSAYSLLS